MTCSNHASTRRGSPTAVQRARFWKFTYESDGLKVCGYMAAPRQSGPLSVHHRESRRQSRFRRVDGYEFRPVDGAVGGRRLFRDREQLSR